MTLDIDYSNMLYCINVHKIGVVSPVKVSGRRFIDLVYYSQMMGIISECLCCTYRIIFYHYRSVVLSIWRMKSESTIKAG